MNTYVPIFRVAVNTYVPIFCVAVNTYVPIFRVAVNTYVPIFRGLDARGGRKLQTDTHTHGTTTVTLVARMRAED